MSGLRLHVMAIVFVAIFSTGFIFSDMGMTGAGPFTFLAYRFLGATAVLLLISLFIKGAWGYSWRQVIFVAIAGLLLQGLYLGAVFFAISRGVPPGVSGIIAGLQPLIALFFYVLLTGRMISGIELFGAVLGFLGVLLIVWPKLGGDTALSLPLAVNFLAAVSYAYGAVFTARYVKSPSKISEMTIQFAASALPLLALGWLVEGLAFQATPLVMTAFAWSTLVLSCLSIFLMLSLISHGGAKYFSFWNFLMPAFAAFYAWAFRDEPITSITLVGVALVLIGLLVVNLTFSKRKLLPKA